MSLGLPLRDLCDVYAENQTTHVFELVQASLACNFNHVNPRAAATGDARAELAELRHVQWQTYVMPEGAQLAFAGHRWNVKANTIATRTGPDNSEVMRTCDVQRADT